VLVSDFDYHLPEELIAQEALPDRAASRMMVVHRATGHIEHRVFRDLPSFLGPGDCLVFNDTRVFPARLLGHRRGFAGQVEALLVKPTTDDRRTWLALVRPGRKVRTGDTLEFGGGLEAEVLGRNEHGERLLRLRCEGDRLMDAIDRVGHTPLPPYIRRPDTLADRHRYQTVFAREPGSVAAPTAGLHFTDEVLAACRDSGADMAWVTLHVGLGTFQPLNADRVEDVRLHSERYRVGPEAAARIGAAKRVVCVGTTSVRTVESTLGREGEGETSLFIAPGHRFDVAGAMVTNFHLPRSSLLVLVAAFGGWNLVRRAYREAVDGRYRFFSYGDCMLLL
jgi:S-adenosylmethionine:tRNA ribosyltransferase-isomerase